MLLTNATHLAVAVGQAGTGERRVVGPGATLAYRWPAPALAPAGASGATRAASCCNVSPA